MKVVSTVLFFSIVAFATSLRFAYVSVLSSNSFLLTAKVLAHRLHVLNDSIPYIIVLTQDITIESELSLKDQGIQIHRFGKIDTPYLETHKARKFQYTKIHLWNMTEYDVITHLDLDLLPMSDISSLFQCGSFCASFRHSDMFNSGVFVLKPNVTVYQEMVKVVKSSYSYDGGDQGFLNTFFSDLKFAPMFDETHVEKQPYQAEMRRLSSVFNYDIGMYYLNGGRMLVTPKIIHYTMGPTKPWVWWTYPLFDLNYLWLQARWDMESSYYFNNSNAYMAMIQPILVFIMYGLKMLTQKLLGEKLLCENVPVNEEFWTLHSIVVISVAFSAQIVPLTAYPLASWAFFACNLAFTATLATSVYSKVRLGRHTPACKMVLAVLLILASISASYMLIGNITRFSTRAITVLAVAVYNQAFIVMTLSKFVLNGESCTFRYRLVSSKSF